MHCSVQCHKLCCGTVNLVSLPCCRTEDQSHSLAPTGRTSTMNINFVPETILTLIIVQILSNCDLLLHFLPPLIHRGFPGGREPVHRFQHSLPAGCDREHTSENAGTTSFVDLILSTMQSTTLVSPRFTGAHSMSVDTSRSCKRRRVERNATTQERSECWGSSCQRCQCNVVFSVGTIDGSGPQSLADTEGL